MIKVKLSGKYGFGKFTTIDDADADILKKMGVRLYLDKAGKNRLYVRFTYKKKKYYLHRFLMNPEKGKFVDHINHNTLDNTRANLRICTHSQSIKKAKPVKNSSSKYKGVRWVGSRNKYRAEICFENKRFDLGYFVKEVDAAIAYNNKAKELFGEFAFLNEIK